MPWDHQSLGWVGMSPGQEEARRLRQQIAALEAENAALREIAEAIAGPGEAADGFGYCVFCDAVEFVDEPGDPGKHEPDCPVTKARALLAKESTDA